MGDSDYTSAVRLILEEVAREQRDSAHYNETVREPALMVKPAVFCTADRGVCGATPTVLECKDSAELSTALYETLLGMYDPDRMDTLF